MDNGARNSCSVLETLNPLTKLGVLALTLASALVSPTLGMAGGVFGLWVVPVLALTGRLVPFAKLIVRFLAPTYLMLVLVYGVLAVPGEGTGFGRASHLYLDSAGVIQATIMVCRLASILGASLAFAHFTSPRELGEGLRRLGVPSPVVAAVVSSFGLVGLVRRRLSAIIDAQRSRALNPGRNPIRRWFAFVPLLRPLFFTMMVSAIERASVWSHRGFLQRKEVAPLRLTRTDWFALSVAGTLAIGCGVERWLHW